MSCTAIKILTSKTHSSVVADESGSSVSISPKSQTFIFQEVVSNFVDGDITTLIEHSIDNVNWITLATFTTTSADSVKHKTIASTVAVGGYIRTSVTTTVGGGAAVDLDVEIKMAYNPLT